MQPDLATYDWILVNSSAGKDSQAMLDLVVECCRATGTLSRVVVVHCDLGRVEWRGTRELAEEQARHYGLRFEVVRRSQNDLLDHVRARGKWPDPARRYCTSDHKRAPVRRLMTALAKEWRDARPPTKAPCRILNCMGMRAQESPGRAKLVPFDHDDDASNGRRCVDTWLPIHGWLVEHVWERIRASGVPHHRAYDLGMPRLSCCFCIFAPEDALMISGEHNPELLAEYVEVERVTGHGFKKNLHLRVIKERLDRGERVKPTASDDGGCWNM